MQSNRFFWRHVAQRGDCWVWTGAHDRDGYGVTTTSPGHKQIRAHRFAYEQMVCEIPAGLTLDHVCGLKACVNPAHLEPVPAFVNNSRGHWKHGRYAQ